LYGDGIKDDVYDNDYSAEDILFYYGHVFGVDYREQIPRDKVAAIGAVTRKQAKVIFKRG
jgi:hypothetical protein